MGVEGRPRQPLAASAGEDDQGAILPGWLREVARGRPAARRRTDAAAFPDDSVTRLGMAIRNFNWIAAVLPEHEASRADILRRFDFVVAQMACAEMETGLVFGSSTQTSRVEWKWWRSNTRSDGGAAADLAPADPDPFDPLRRGEAGRVTLAIREGTPQILFALRQLLSLLPTQDIEVHPLPPEADPTAAAPALLREATPRQ